MIAISTSQKCPHAGFALRKAVLSSSVRWRTADGKVFRVARRNAAPAAEARLVAVSPTPPAGRIRRVDGGVAHRHRALSLRGDYSSERAGRCPLEAIQRF